MTVGAAAWPECVWVTQTLGLPRAQGGLGLGGHSEESGHVPMRC